MKFSYKTILLHVFICLGFLTIPFVFWTAEIISFHEVLNNPINSFITIFYPLLLLFYYLQYYVLIPTFYSTKKYGRFILVLILIVFLFGALYFVLDYLPFHSHVRPPHHHAPPPLMDNHPHHFDDDGDQHSHPHPHPHPHPIFHHPPPIIELSQLLFLYSIGIFVTLYIRAKKYISTIEQERNNAELSYLKSQINPHFLFNTFNSIYSLAIKEHADKTANGMLKLSGMMRYVVSETSADSVPLEKEISYINDFIELQKLRLDKDVHLNYLVEGIMEDKQIAPLLLIPFIENAFKHGVNPDEDSLIDIHIQVTEQELNMMVSNNKVTINPNTHERMGFGIENTKTRLNLLYPDMHHLKITDSEKIYKVELKLNLS